jgi:hypothetical protein
MYISTLPVNSALAIDGTGVSLYLVDPIQPPYNLDGGVTERARHACDIWPKIVGLGVRFPDYRRKEHYVVCVVVIVFCAA